MRTLFGLVVFSCTLPAGTVFSLPTAAYTSGTNLIPITVPDESVIGSISDGNEMVSFSSQMTVTTVGDDWATWGSPPNTESSTPQVLWSGDDQNFNPVTTVTFLLSVPVTIFGFEAEPDDTAGSDMMTATFYMGGTLEQTIALNVDGNGGAMLFAAGADPGAYFDSVTLTSDIDWAVAEVRYATPEPGCLALVLAGLGVMFKISRRGRQ
jgi:hypothetical protein